jgi:hypothetical protein
MLQPSASGARAGSATRLAVRVRGCETIFSTGICHSNGVSQMGDKSPKSKQREQKQKDTQKQQVVVSAKNKQDGQRQQVQPDAARGKK